MSAIQSLVLALVVCFLAEGHRAAAPVPPDPAHLREMLYDRQQPLQQSQAAMLLVQSRAPEGAAVIRQGLQAATSAEVFQALANALCLAHDGRFVHELLAA